MAMNIQVMVFNQTWTKTTITLSLQQTDGGTAILYLLLKIEVVTNF